MSFSLSDEDRNPWRIFIIFLRLGLTSFGGPIAHLAYFRDEFVTRRCWLSERSYGDLVTLCQFLPGPASSQVGMALGLSRAGYAGALAAWAGFTLPSAVALVLFAGGLSGSLDAIAVGILQGLKVVAVAVVAQAVWGMARHLCPDALRVSMMAIAACTVLLVPSAWGQVGVLVVAGVVGLWLCKPVTFVAHDQLPVAVGRGAGVFWLVLFVALLFGLPILARLMPGQIVAMVDAFFRAGALIFGGGHVMLPLLEVEVVQSGWIPRDVFLAGYGATQAVPGPLSTFAAFLGASMPAGPSGWRGGLIALLAIFAPSFLLVVGVMPFWERLCRSARLQAAMLGINAAVVGLLLAALYQPVWTSTIHQPRDFGLALIALVALMIWKLPPWLVVMGSAVLGWLLSQVG